MFSVRQTQPFASWLGGLRDDIARARIAARLRRLEGGHFGDTRSIGDGVRELRLHHGPGFRVYFAQRGEALILLLCGGDKSSQRRDIEAAKQMLRDWED
jgi:putative addiction module killer protein